MSSPSLPLGLRPLPLWHLMRMRLWCPSGMAHLGAVFWGMLLALGPAPPVQAAQVIKPAPSVTLKVGETVVVHGLKGSCGHLPARGQMVSVMFRTGHLGYGGPALRHVKDCGGLTPVIATLFTADTPGTEVISLYGDIITLRVTP